MSRVYAPIHVVSPEAVSDHERITYALQALEACLRLPKADRGNLSEERCSWFDHMVERAVTGAPSSDGRVPLYIVKDEKVIGAALIHPPTCYISRFFVIPEVRATGAASLFLRSTLGYLSACQKVTLVTYSRSATFYKREGFEMQKGYEAPFEMGIKNPYYHSKIS